MTKLCVILPDQLSHSISSISHISKNDDLILIAEVDQEFTYVKHHKKKIAFLISAMRHFSQELRQKGFNVLHTQIESAKNTHSITSEVEQAVKAHSVSSVIVTHPGEYRILEYIKNWEKSFKVPVEILPDSRFLSTPEEFSEWASDKKQLRMEFFYRNMRQKHNILMNNGKPEGGKWNYDSANRKPPKSGLDIPKSFVKKPNDLTQSIMSIVAKRYDDHFGNLEPFYFAVNRDQAIQALKKFISERLPLFGDYQDAMIENEPWMFHAHIGFYLNCGLLLPIECIHAAEQAYTDKKAPLNAVEGFVRQILGWREYIRGIYWLKMPEYEHLNFFEASRKLPEFYWTGETKMNCLKQCVTETKENAYAHHIQRLMVLGNFALIAGLSPKEVNEWYLIVYADAYQWVELPNVSGMVLYADGGFLASKPYAAGGSYINKMSNYCKNCVYSVTKKEGPDACPFNYLYWDFLIRNRKQLQSNQRIGMMYHTYDRMDESKKAAIQQDSKLFLDQIK